MIADWNAGKIPFYTEPPVLAGVHVSASVVSTWAKELNLDDVMEQEKTTVISTLTNRPSDFLVFDSTNYGAVDRGFVGDEEEMEAEEEEYEGMDGEEGEEEEEEEGDMEYDSDGEGASVPLNPSSLAYQKQKMRDEEDNLNVQVNKKLHQLLKKKKKKGADELAQQKVRLPKIRTPYQSQEEDGDDTAFSFARDFVADNDMEDDEDDDEEEEEEGGEKEEEDDDDDDDDDDDEGGNQGQDVELFDVDDI